jgi:hypothetical protein
LLDRMLATAPLDLPAVDAEGMAYASAVLTT